MSQACCKLVSLSYAYRVNRPLDKTANNVDCITCLKSLWGGGALSIIVIRFYQLSIVEGWPS